MYFCRAAVLILDGSDLNRDYSRLLRLLYSEGVQFLAALKILLKVEREPKPESMATSVMEILG